MSRRSEMKAKREELKEQAKNFRENYEKGFQNKAFPLDFNRLNDFKFYEVKEGVNRISIVCYKVATDNDPIAKKGSYCHVLLVYTHKGIGVNKQHTIICPRRTFGNKPCPKCDDWEAEYAEVQDSKEVATSKAVCRPYYVVIDEDDPNREIQLFQAAYEHFEKRMQSKLNSIVARGGEALIPWDDDKGNIVVFDGEKSKNYDYIEPVNFDFENREPLDIKNDDVPSLDEYMNIYSYEEIRKLEITDEDDDVPQDDSDAETITSDTIQRRDSRRETKKEEPKEENRCPGGGKFGHDHNSNEMESTCSNEEICNNDTYNACQEENARIEEAKKKNKLERGRRRNS